MSDRDFVYTGLPARVIFGDGTTSVLPDELDSLGITRPLILTTPPQESHGRQLADALDGKHAGIFPGATMHTPVAVTERAMEAFAKSGADGIVAIGGGSTIGLGKAIALRNDAPQVVLPTTYAGSEMTSIIGQTEGGRKTTQRTLAVLPETVIYDVEYTMTLPLGMSITSGMNAIAHAVEAMYSQGSNPVLDLMAEEAVRAMTGALDAIITDPQDREARLDAMYGAWLCALCLASGGVALHHKLCHTLGGSFDLPHAETHTIVLPHALAYNAPSVPRAMDRLSRAMGSDAPALGLYELAKRGGVEMDLAALGMPEDGIATAADIAMETPYPNPRPLERDAIEALIRRAWAGERPA